MGGMSPTVVSSGCARSAVYAYTSRPRRDIQATAARVSRPPEKAMPMRVPSGGGWRGMRAMVRVTSTTLRRLCAWLPRCIGGNTAPMRGIARTSATGDGGMLEELVAWSSSLEDDHALVREDLLGSAAHVTMLGRAGIIPVADARRLRD